jgi:hypothetical protein
MSIAKVRTPADKERDQQVSALFSLGKERRVLHLERVESPLGKKVRRIACRPHRTRFESSLHKAIESL